MTKLGYGVCLMAPHTTRALVIDGRLVPRMHVTGDGERLTLVLDGRFGCDGTPAEVAKWARMVAEALAIGTGYSHIGAEAPVRPFAPIVQEISDDPATMQ